MKKLPTGSKLAELVLDPCFRCLQREYNIYYKLLDVIYSDLKFTHAVLTNAEESNNRARNLFNFLQLENIPTHWLKYGSTALKCRTKASLWIPDFAKRIALFAPLGSMAPIEYGNTDMWLGGFMAPAAWIAATKQAIANRHGWSIEELTLKTTVDDSSDRKDSFTFEGMRMFGAKWSGGAIAIDNDDLSFKMPKIRFTWIKKEIAKKDKTLYANIPIYLDESREQFVWAVKLKRPKDVPPTVWDQRGVCLTVWEI